MTSAQLILVSVSSALIAVITMLVVAVALRARTREGSPAGTGAEASTGNQTRAQRAAARAQRRAQKATARAERKVQKATAAAAKKSKPDEDAASRDKAPTGGETPDPGQFTTTTEEPHRGMKSKDAPATEAGRQAAAAGGPQGSKTTEPSSSGSDADQKTQT
jgi:hypothetical protein